MTLRYRLLFVAKCGLLSLLIPSFLVMIYLMLSSDVMQRIIGSSEQTSTQDDLRYNTSRSQKNFSWSMLDENFDKCLLSTFISPDIPFLNTSMTDSSFNEIQTSSEKNETEPMFKIVQRFSDLLFSLFGVDIALIEPALLFCMLSPSHKDLLLKRNFSLSIYTNQKTSLTFVVRAEHVGVLEESVSLEEMKKHGFTAEFVKEELADWMDETDSLDESFTSHIFYKNGDWTLHLVVFYKRRKYLWHAALTSGLTDNSIGELYFTESASAYENFTFVSLGFKDDYMSNIRIPSNPQYFLFEMASSRFLECNTTLAAEFKKYDNITMQEDLFYLPLRKFRRLAVKGMKEMKAIFHPLLMHLWIWSGTMLGWYRQCGIISYTSDVDFAAWAPELDDSDELVKRINESKHLSLREIMGVPEEAYEFNTNCHGLRIDLFFIYPESNGTWCSGHRPSKGYYIRYHHPTYNLCSGELLGQKVIVPCETEKVISWEYGPTWMEPAISWNYESSIQNRGPNIYWDKEMLDKVYWYA